MRRAPGASKPPILRGKDIKRYGYQWAGKWLIATFPSRHYDINDYPAVEHWLLTFAQELLLDNGFDWIANDSDKLQSYCYQRLAQTGKRIIIDGKPLKFEKNDKARKKTVNKWFETQDSISYWEDFDQPKVMYPNMTKYLPFYYDDRRFYQNDKSFMITGTHIAYLTAFLNSSLFKFCFKDNFPELLGGTRELRKIFFDKIPVIQISREQNAKFAEAVEDIQKEYSTAKAIAIDNMIFDLYDLSSEERHLIGYIEIK